MAILLNYSEIKMLSHVLTTTGETEVGADGKEVLSPRRLNGEESSQRRHFTGAVKDVVESTEKTIKELSEKHNEVVKEVRETAGIKSKKGDKNETATDLLVAKDERVTTSFEAVNKEIKELIEKKHDIMLTPKTLEVVKKYLKSFGDSVGFAAGDDATISSLEEALK